MFTILALFFIIGTFFWSFSTVLIERWKHGKGGILFGRSECPHCHHALRATSLIPILSYIFQWGKCRDCNTKISSFYPVSECIMWVIFFLVWLFILRNNYDLISPTTLVLLILGFITGVYILYDARYLEIPDQIMVPWIYGYLILIIWVWQDWWRADIIFDTFTYKNWWEFLYDHIFWAFILYTFFYIQIVVPGGAFLLRKRKIKDFLWLLVSYFSFPFTLIFECIRKTDAQNQEDDIPTWVGWGDLRVALFIGLTLGTIHGVMAVFFAYIIGSIAGLAIISQRKGKKKDSRISFWPFLGIGWIIVLCLHSEIISHLYK